MKGTMPVSRYLCFYEKVIKSQADVAALLIFSSDIAGSRWRYYNGAPPDVMRFGSAWPGVDFELVDKNAEIAPDIHLIALVSNKPGTLELRELSLAINTAEGVVIVVGCSHPGVDRIVAAAARINPRIHAIAGGFRLVVTSDADIETIVAALHHTYKVEYAALGHCTGEPALTALKQTFGDRYLYARVGRTVELVPVAEVSCFMFVATRKLLT
jgi:7,8-dihydropterin-6-yl-methyl-4-(beta-D-ribofuranosyl)aminobenzene 5'-phosphate synthase